MLVLLWPNVLNTPLYVHYCRLNMLIAIMADSCKTRMHCMNLCLVDNCYVYQLKIVCLLRCVDEKVKENERVEALRERAQIIVESERTRPGSHRYHKYMHIVLAADSNNVTEELQWEGITGRVKQLLELQDERVKKLLQSQDQRSENMLKAIESRLDAKLVAIDRKCARQGAEHM